MDLKKKKIVTLSLRMTAIAVCRFKKIEPMGGVIYAKLTATSLFYIQLTK
jgi:hypothetical protein